MSGGAPVDLRDHFAVADSTSDSNTGGPLWFTVTCRAEGVRHDLVKLLNSHFLPPESALVLGPVLPDLVEGAMPAGGELRVRDRVVSRVVIQAARIGEHSQRHAGVRGKSAPADSREISPIMIARPAWDLSGNKWADAI